MPIMSIFCLFWWCKWCNQIWQMKCCHKCNENRIFYQPLFNNFLRRNQNSSQEVFKIMVAIPTVKSFCGCCELKIPCIVIAVLRLIAYIFAVLTYLYLFVFLDMAFKEKQNRYFKEEQAEILIKVLAFAVGVNTFVSIFFIVGARVVSYEFESLGLISETDNDFF